MIINEGGSVIQVDRGGAVEMALPQGLHTQCLHHARTSQLHLLRRVLILLLRRIRQATALGYTCSDPPLVSSPPVIDLSSAGSRFLDIPVSAAITILSYLHRAAKTATPHHLRHPLSSSLDTYKHHYQSFDIQN